MATQTREVEEEIIIRAESLHIHDPPNRVNDKRINPNTGHMEPEDAAAINWAAGPDRPDPPSERAFPHHGGGRGRGRGSSQCLVMAYVTDTPSRRLDSYIILTLADVG